ncbi:MAG: transposase [Pseudolabrys sp.]
MRQRQTWNLRHHHRLRRILCHPDRQLRQGAVGLTDGHSDIVTTAIATGYDDRLPVTGMKSVTDNRLAQLIVSIMKLSRRHQARSALAKTEAFKQSSRDRKRVEMLFAHMKRILRLGRLRLRGPCGAQFEFTLAASAQNLRRLAKLVARPPPFAPLRAA